MHFFEMGSTFRWKAADLSQDSGLNLGTLVKALQGQLDAIGFKAYHHVIAYGYDRHPESPARYFPHFLKRCLVTGHVVGSKRNPFLRKELLRPLAMRSGWAGVYLDFFTHGNLHGNLLCLKGLGFTTYTTLSRTGPL